MVLWLTVLMRFFNQSWAEDASEEAGCMGGRPASAPTTDLSHHLPVPWEKVTHSYCRQSCKACDFVSMWCMLNSRRVGVTTTHNNVADVCQAVVGCDLVVTTPACL